MDNNKDTGLCPQLRSCALADVAVQVLQTIARIEAASEATRKCLETNGHKGLVDKVDDLETLRDIQIGQNKILNRILGGICTVMLAMIVLGIGIWNTNRLAAISNEAKFSTAKAERDNLTSKAQGFTDNISALDIKVDKGNTLSIADRKNIQESVERAIARNHVMGQKNNNRIGNVQDSVNQLSNDVNAIQNKKTSRWWNK